MRGSRSLRAIAAGVIAGVTAGAVLLGSGTGAAESDSPMRRDGTLDRSRLPKAVKVLNCAGEVVGEMREPYSDSAPAWTPPGVPGVCEAPSMTIIGRSG